jgi:ABC-type transport system involved in multi-copper enzyme maturation permease subunit
MNFLIWKLHRNQVLVAVIAFAALATVLVTSGIHMRSIYRAALRTCSASGTCGDLQNRVFQGYGLVLDIVLATLIVPFLLGMFWGAPLLSKDFENGTHNLVWTQSISRRRWFGVNVAWALLSATLYGAALSALVTWWRTPVNSLFGRMSPLLFDLQGIAPLAYCVFAVSLGIMFGAWFRRVIPAMSTTLGFLVAIRVVILLYVRPHFSTPSRVNLSLTTDVQTVGHANAWELSRTIVDNSGHVIDNGFASIPPLCHESLFKGSVLNCLAKQGYRRLVTYQPDSRFWTFQGIEAGLFICLAAFCLAFAFRLVTHRDA